ncbi:MAG: hypothetical protein KAW16_00790 [candidate division Zixibacteria bacterium]|nr:hypothetical protein [candidate division Zixibacteria bacterium]
MSLAKALIAFQFIAGILMAADLLVPKSKLDHYNSHLQRILARKRIDLSRRIKTLDGHQRLTTVFEVIWIALGMLLFLWLGDVLGIPNTGTGGVFWGFATFVWFAFFFYLAAKDTILGLQLLTCAALCWGIRFLLFCPRGVIAGVGLILFVVLTIFQMFY